MRIQLWVLLLAVTAVILTGCSGDRQSGLQKSGGAAAIYSSMPDIRVKTNKTYLAHVKTTDGDFTIKLYAKEAPITVNNFVFLAQHHFYDGLKFHRIIKSTLIQTGDPGEDGTGGPGYTIPDELDKGYKYEEGVVAMANKGEPNSSGSQFFIGTGPDVEALNQTPSFTIFGTVESGMDTIHKIAQTPVELNDADNELSKPTADIVIQSIEIEIL